MIFSSFSVPAAFQCRALGLNVSLSVNFWVQIKVFPGLRLSYLSRPVVAEWKCSVSFPQSTGFEIVLFPVVVSA